MAHTTIASFANDNSSADCASDAKSTLTPSVPPRHDATLDRVSDATSTLTPSTPPVRDPALRSQTSDRSTQSKSTIREFYDEGQGWGAYDGELDSEGRRHGNGLMFWDNGEVFEGGWINDRPHGEGTKTWPKGSQYTGGWKEGLRDGWGEMQYTDGSRYQGGWRGGIQQGKGTWWSATGSAYAGEWEDGQGTLIPLQPSALAAPAALLAAEDTSDQEPPLPISSLVISKPLLPQPNAANHTGQGEISRQEFNDGGTWVGEMDMEGRRCGSGILTDGNGNVYEGTWAGDKMGGLVTCQFSDGGVYVGNYEDSMANGWGICRFANEDVYEGEWKDGDPEGQGRFQLAIGHVFEGEWKDGKLEWGTSRLASGEVYEGEYKDGKRRGTHWIVNGEVYEGEWKGGKMSGQGTNRLVNGEPYESKHEDGKLINGRGKLQSTIGHAYQGGWEDGNQNRWGISQLPNGDTSNSNGEDDNDDLSSQQAKASDQALRREVQEMKDDSVARVLPLEIDGSTAQEDAIEPNEEGRDDSQGRDGGDAPNFSSMKSSRSIAIIQLSLLAAIALAVVFGRLLVEESPSADHATPPCFINVQDRYVTAKEIVSSITSQDILDLVASPQRKALEWIVCEDEISSKLMDARDPATGLLPKQAHGSRHGGDSGEAQVLRRYALAAFHFATSERGPWNQTLNFLSPDAHECSWHQNFTTAPRFGWAGVDSAGFVCFAQEYVPGMHDVPITLDDSAREIVFVDFKIRLENNLTGTIPSEFGSLIDVRAIGLEHHKGLYGTLPSTIANMINLESLSILFFGPDFGGPFPKSLFSIPALENISLYYNEGVWSFPPTIDPDGRSKLLGMYMAYTGLSGTLPPYLSGFKDLKELHLVGNSLEGSIPEFIGYLSSLQYLSVHDNNLNGSLPSWLGRLTSLHTLELGKNSFSGSIPSWIGNLSKLRLLDLGHNELEGELPPSVSDMSSLELVSLQNNLNLNGSIAPFGSLGNLASLLVYSNNFSSSIPSEIFSNYSHSGKRIFADFGQNSFTGTLPATFSQWVSNISYLSTMKNALAADAVPDEVCNDSENLYVDCSSCQCCQQDCCSDDSSRGGSNVWCGFDLDFINVAKLDCGVSWPYCWENSF